MTKQNDSLIEKQAAAKAARRLKKQRPKMKVSGARVKALQKLVIGKAK